MTSSPTGAHTDGTVPDRGDGEQSDSLAPELADFDARPGRGPGLIHSSLAGLGGPLVQLGDGDRDRPRRPTSNPLPPQPTGGIARSRPPRPPHRLAHRSPRARRPPQPSLPRPRAPPRHPSPEFQGPRGNGTFRGLFRRPRLGIGPGEPNRSGGREPVVAWVQPTRACLRPGCPIGNARGESCREGPASARVVPA